MLSNWLLYRLFTECQSNEFLRRFLEGVKEVIPKPFLTPTVSYYKLRGYAFILRIDTRSPGKTNTACFSSDFSTREMVSGDRHDAVVHSMDTQLRLKCLKGHNENVTVVRFNADAPR